MNLFARLAIVLMIGSFPFAIYYFQTVASGTTEKTVSSDRSSESVVSSSDVAVNEMSRGVEKKAKELKEIEVKILQSRGSILKLEEDKQTFVRNLESIRTQITDVIKNVKSGQNSRQ